MFIDELLKLDEVLLALESCAGITVLLAARWNALATFTDVSFTLHLSGLGGVLITREPTTRPPAVVSF